MAWNNIVPAKCLTPKKPRAFNTRNGSCSMDIYKGLFGKGKLTIEGRIDELDAKQARRLAKWLLDAANFIEMSEK